LWSGEWGGEVRGERRYLSGYFYTATKSSYVVSSADCVVVQEERGSVVEAVCEVVEECYWYYMSISIAITLYLSRTNKREKIRKKVHEKHTSQSSSTHLISKMSRLNTSIMQPPVIMNLFRVALMQHTRRLLHRTPTIGFLILLFISRVSQSLACHFQRHIIQMFRREMGCFLNRVARWYVFERSST
jgi:hypothetical protein